MVEKLTDEVLAEKISKPWSELKHSSSTQTDIIYPLSQFFFEVAKFNPKQTEKNGKKIVFLGYGEPTKENGFEIPPVLTEAVIEVAKSEESHGYTYQFGSPEARQAIVDKYSQPPKYTFQADDVFFTFGCHNALFLSINALCSKGDNILLPKPSFPLYKPICDNLGVEIKWYDLIPEKDWEINLETVKSLIDSKTQAILVCNPSNPCSTVFSKEHQLEIIKVAQEFKVPLLCDEVYYGLVFPGKEFHSFANLTDDVPMICVNSLSKVFQVPGWRLGWIIVYNRHGFLDIVKDHMKKYMRIPFHPCTLIMNALPKILRETPQSYFDDYAAKLGETSNYIYERCSSIRGLVPYRPTAAMYMMARVCFELFRPDCGITTDREFVIRAWEEESVLMVPCDVFHIKGFVRIVTCVSKENADEFEVRMKRFLEKILI